MKLRTFTFVMSTAFLTFVVVLAGFLSLVTTRMELAGAEIGTAVHGLRAAEELQIHLLNHNREELLYGLTKSRIHGLNRNREKLAIDHWLHESGIHLASQEEAELHKQAVAAARSYLSAREQASSTKSPLDAYNDTSPMLNAAFETAERLTSLNFSQVQVLRQQIEDYDQTANWLGIFGALLALVVFPVSWLIVRKQIYLPVTDLHHSIGELQQSNPRTVEARGFKEIGEIIKAFNEFSFRLTEQKKGQLRFLAAVAHDLRNPLSGIQMASQILLEEEAAVKEKRSLIGVIARQAKQLDRMVGDLLDSTRIESGELELERQSVDLNSLLSDAVSLNRSVSSLHKISFQPDEKRIHCFCDPTRVGQVINNLLSNAIKYSPNGGAIKVSSGIRGENAFFRVTDEGIGISLEDQKFIFEPFRRTALTKASIPGIGLGLSTVRRIVKAHGGEIEIESQPQAGATFTVVLPLEEDVKSRGSRDEPHNPKPPQTLDASFH